MTLSKKSVLPRKVRKLSKVYRSKKTKTIILLSSENKVVLEKSSVFNPEMFKFEEKRAIKVEHNENTPKIKLPEYTLSPRFLNKQSRQQSFSPEINFTALHTQTVDSLHLRKSLKNELLSAQNIANAIHRSSRDNFLIPSLNNEDAQEIGKVALNKLSSLKKGARNQGLLKSKVQLFRFHNQELIRKNITGI